MAVTLVSAVGSLAIAPAFGDNDDHRGRGNNNARGERHGDRDHNFRGRGPAFRHPYFYSAPVYAPAPVYYPPQPSPGVSLFLPLNIHVR